MWTEERSYEQDTAMGFTLEMTHADGGRVEHQFRAESLDDVLMHIGYFVRGCGFVVQATDTLDFIPDDSEPSESGYEEGYRDGIHDGIDEMRARAETLFMHQFNVTRENPLTREYNERLWEDEDED